MKAGAKLGVGFFLVVSMLVGCGGLPIVSKGEKKPTVVTIWNYYNGAQKEAFDSLVQLFNETEGATENIVIESVSKGAIAELTQALYESADKKVGSSPLPQICATYADTAYDINQRGLIVDIGACMTEEELGEYVDAYREEGVFKEGDTLKLFPVAKSTEVLTVNMTDWNVFAEATGASTDSFQTWEGLALVAEQYYNWSGGDAFFGRDAFANYILVGSRQLGHDIFQVKNGEMTLDYNKAAMRRLWDNYYVPFMKGYYTADGKFRSDDLKTGTLIALVGSTSGTAYTPSVVTYEDGTSYAIDCQIFPLPNFEGTNPMAVQQGAGMVVLKSTPEQEKAAVDFLKWFTREENNISFCIKSGYLPVKKAANSDQAFQKALEVSTSERLAIIKQSFQVGSKIVRDYELYTTKAFAYGNDARTLLGRSMSDRALTDREALQTLMNDGMTREEALEQFLTDENFQQWYAESYQKLVALGK